MLDVWFLLQYHPDGQDFHCQLKVRVGDAAVRIGIRHYIGGNIGREPHAPNQGWHVISQQEPDPTDALCSRVMISNISQHISNKFIHVRSTQAEETE